MPSFRLVRPPSTGLLLALCLALPAVAADSPDVRALMSPEEFEAAGLGKLSPAEIEALNRWVLRYTAKDAPVLRVQSEVVREEIRKVDAEGFRTQIVGAFRGWDGDTIFHLANGQTWKQRLPGRFVYRADSPEVELRKNMLGYWMLRLVEANRSVGVSPVD
jgi:hypothetical protein